MAEMSQSLSLVDAGNVALKVFLAEMGQNSLFYPQLYSEKNQVDQGGGK